MRLFGSKTLALQLAFTTLLLTSHASYASDSTVFAFGDNGLGQAGVGSGLPAWIATSIDDTNLQGTTISDVDAGITHSLLLGEDGTVFSFGWNNLGRTGLGIADESETPIATPIDTTNLTGVTIAQIAAGGVHNLLLSSDGDVFSFGHNSSGRTGLGFANQTSTALATPIDESNIAGVTIRDIAAGGSHSLLLSDSGDVFSFGSNSTGQTGVGQPGGLTVTDVPLATPIDEANLGGKSVSQIAAGADHSLLLAEDGSVYSFGSNEGGGTGLGLASGNTLVATPIDLSNLGDRSVVQMAAGDRFSLLLADDGSVFSFGDNADGKTGQGITEGITSIASRIDNRFLGRRTIVQVAAGYDHSLLLSDDGTIFTFGLSTGQNPPVFGSPFALARPIDMTNFGDGLATDIATGWFHSLVLTSPKPVPEPTTAAIALLALVPLAVWRTSRAGRTLAVVVLAVTGANLATAAEFIPLGFEMQLDFYSKQIAVAENGSVVVGGGQVRKVHVWTPATGTQILPGYFDETPSVSGDGSTIVTSRGTIQDLEAVKIVDGDVQVFPGTAGQSEGLAISQNGDSVFVRTKSVSTGLFDSYYRWSSAGIVELPIDRPPKGVSAEGDVLIFDDLAVWSEQGGVQQLPVAGSPDRANAYGLSSNGRWAVGRIRPSGGVTENWAVRWDGLSQPQRLLPANEKWGAALLDITPDGEIAVGQLYPTEDIADWVAGIWTESTGMISLQDLLVTEYGPGGALDGWRLAELYDITDDGRFLAGRAVNPMGNDEAFLVDLVPIPEPSSTALALVGLVPLVLGRSRNAFRLNPEAKWTRKRS